MGVDQNEAKRRRRADGPKYNADPNIPFAAIPHRVMDSPAFADLTGSQVKVLTVVVRQLTVDRSGDINNGQLQATFAYISRFGVGAEKTVQRALKALIEHGFLYRTKAGAYGQGMARYAVTWLPLSKNRDGLTHLDWFKSCAWHSWEKGKPVRSGGAVNPAGHGKSNRSKIPSGSGRNVRSPVPPTDKTTGAEPDKNADDVNIPISGVASGGSRPSGLGETDWMTTHLADLKAHGLGGRQCFRLPALKTLQ